MHGHHMGHGMNAYKGNCLCGRQFLTNEEKIKHLENYKKWLDNESKGVQEAIDNLKKTS